MKRLKRKKHIAGVGATENGCVTKGKSAEVSVLQIFRDIHIDTALYSELVVLFILTEVNRLFLKLTRRNSSSLVSAWQCFHGA